MDRADLLGQAAAVAGLRRAIRAAVEPKDPPFLLVGLYRAALLEKDETEVHALASLLDRSSEPLVVRQRVLLDLVYGGAALDDALAAVMAEKHADLQASYLGFLWGRHVTAGFDAGFDQRLAAAVCPK